MGPIVRIALRYVTLPLLALGLILPHEQQEIIADPEIVTWVATALGAIAPVVAEGWYLVAKWLGWRT